MELKALFMLDISGNQLLLLFKFNSYSYSHSLIRYNCLDLVYFMVIGSNKT